MVDSQDEQQLCRFCGSQMASGFVFCKECDHFNDWRRHFNVSTTVLSLLVALFSVLGLNLSAIFDLVFPSRASLAVGAAIVSPFQINLTATNIGEQPGYLGSSINCRPANAGGNYLSFASGIIDVVAPGAQAESVYHVNSTYWIKFFEALESGQLDLDHIPTDGYGYQYLNEELGGDWRCSISAYDQFGEVPTKIPERTPIFWLKSGEIGGRF